ncbi:hypothetical protein [Aeromicrobium sp. HA]|uniref:hypothetical protein n=1 Tax=Aeromicrobium sp. HA TaxID=3009077 RepID=UPI0022AE8116|nr:hypothetical protein [Aeromicrobium sp. HA]
MNVLPLGNGVAEALEPSAVAAHGGVVSHDLRILLTYVKLAGNMAHLTKSKGTRLTQLANVGRTEFHFGTPATGLLLSPIDELGKPLHTDGTRHSLSTVFSVAILAVGLPLKEAS